MFVVSDIKAMPGINEQHNVITAIAEIKPSPSFFKDGD